MFKDRIIAFVGVGLIIIYQYISYGYYLLHILGNSHPVLSISLFIVLSCLVLMIFWSFTSSVFLDPGYIHFMGAKVPEDQIEKAKVKSKLIKQKVWCLVYLEL